VTVRYLDIREIAFQGAVKLAIESAQACNWKNAARANRQAIALAPGDIESHNRLGKALAELGRIAEAIDVYEATTRLDPHNTIANRNLERLGRIAASMPKRQRSTAPKTNGRGGKAARRSNNGADGKTEGHKKARPGAFLADRGRSTVTQLRNLAPASVLAMAAPGDFLTLEPEEGAVAVTAPNGGHLGALDARLGSRLARLMAGGNRYEAVVASSTERAVSLLIREVYRAPALARYASFPKSPVGDETSDQDAPDADDLPGARSDRSYVADDEEREPLSETARAERLKGLLTGPAAAAESDSLAV